MLRQGPRLRPGFLFPQAFARAVAAVLICAAFAGCSRATPVENLDDPLLRGFGRDSLAIGRGEPEHRFSVYVARTPEQRAQGLMYVESMPADVGMLFFFDGSSRASMWMKNTVLSLDMLFIRGNGEVESIAADTTPGSLKSIRSRGRVCCVLELNAGTAKRLGIEAGDTVYHSAFGNL